LPVARTPYQREASQSHARPGMQDLHAPQSVVFWNPGAFPRCSPVSALSRAICPRSYFSPNPGTSQKITLFQLVELFLRTSWCGCRPPAGRTNPFARATNGCDAGTPESGICALAIDLSPPSRRRNPWPGAPLEALANRWRTRAGTRANTLSTTGTVLVLGKAARGGASMASEQRNAQGVTIENRICRASARLLLAGSANAQGGGGGRLQCPPPSGLRRQLCPPPTDLHARRRVPTGRRCRNANRARMDACLRQTDPRAPRAIERGR
jgi:hypothetical protein